MSADHGVWRGDLPHDRACLTALRRQTVGARSDVLNLHRALLPHLAAEVRSVFPQTVADRIGVEELVGRHVLDRLQMTPTPDERLAGAKGHLHRRVRLACPAALDRLF